ncbi:uncharacterized protein HME9304_01546 [Flagellimonas maritima]|uniref:Glycosyltransferase 2-like domain-containing protein n=1 Tax=Flagellimonas maritima TaxID=1383885 RepID=A0A2Z4LRU0_9FLAO|nr:glycosyltransferase family 2 protein [Allomuricauda aurantiaca]AWX44543.1 uncharacterized protein HME9304_01546 [Allomuricauda aurantiaca]
MSSKIAVVIPAFKVSNSIEEVIQGIPEIVSNIIVVDDKCPKNSGKIAGKVHIKQGQKLHIIFHDKNKGVGGAVVSGYKKALLLNSDCVVKLDGDGQMDIKFLEVLVEPISKGLADYSKGNRFVDFKSLRTMPKVRLFGNSVLSFVLKMVSGYWDIMDPTNGYTCISKRALKKINMEKLANRYFFESDMLVNLNINKCVVKDIPMPSKYGDEESSLNVNKILFQFPPYLFARFTRRLFLKYYIYDFNMASVYILIGFPMLVWGLCFGLYKWVEALQNNTLTSTGTVMLSVLPLILGVQLILQAINIDINSVPKKKNEVIH